MIFLPVGTLLDKILYPSGMADTSVDLYYSYPPTCWQEIPAEKTNESKWLTHFSPYDL